MHSTRTLPREAPPGLTALVIYLRPAPRARLLATLAGLGIFVTEEQGPACLREPGLRPPADISLLVAGSSDEHATLLQGLVTSSTAAVVACVPRGSDIRRYLDLGALACLTDDDVSDPSRLAFVAHHAREQREQRGFARGGRVFGDIEFRVAPPSLARGRVSVPLSRSEKEVLRCLASHAGRPVAQSDLEAVAAKDDAEVHPGFLKAVVMRIRRKVDELGGDPMLLRTVRGFGYILIG